MDICGHVKCTNHLLVVISNHPCARSADAYFGLIHTYTRDGALQIQLHFVGSGRGRGVRFGPCDGRPSVRGDLAQRHRLYRRLAQGLVKYIRGLRRFGRGLREV